MRLFREKIRAVFLFLLLLSLATFSLLLICGNSEGQFCSFLSDYSIYFGAGSIHLGLFSAAMYYLWNKDLKTTLRKIAFPGNMLRNTVLSITGFMLVMMVLLMLGIVAQHFGFSDQEAVYEKVSDLPFYILIFAVTVAPISEELFFRALLVPRTGVILSSLLFGAMHFAYGSVVEVAGAALIGIVLAVIFRVAKSITPCLIIHIVYNLMSIAVMRLLL